MGELIEKGRISASQLMFSVCYYMQGSILVTAFYAAITKQDSWIILITGALASLPFLGIYIYIIKQFPGKNFMQINDLILGPFLGKIFSIMYIFFFITIASFNLRDVGNFVAGSLMPETPMISILILFMFICAWAVYKGIEVIVRYSMFLTYLWIITIFFTVILSITNIDLKNFLPVLSLPFSAYVHGTHTSNVIAFNEVIVFMVFLPYVRDKKLIKKSFFWGFFWGLILLFIIVARDIAVLGKFSGVFSLPTYESLRLINVAEIFTRIEIIFAILRLIVMFFKICILYYAAVLCIAQICKLKTYKPIIFIIGAIIISYSILVFNSPLENAVWGKETAPFFSSFFELVLPAITFIIFKIKKKTIIT